MRQSCGRRRGHLDHATFFSHRHLETEYDWVPLPLSQPNRLENRMRIPIWLSGLWTLMHGIADKSDHLTDLTVDLKAPLSLISPAPASCVHIWTWTDGAPMIDPCIPVFAPPYWPTNYTLPTQPQRRSSWTVDGKVRQSACVSVSGVH